MGWDKKKFFETLKTIINPSNKFHEKTEETMICFCFILIILDKKKKKKPNNQGFITCIFSNKSRALARSDAPCCVHLLGHGLFYYYAVKMHLSGSSEIFMKIGLLSVKKKSENQVKKKKNEKKSSLYHSVVEHYKSVALWLCFTFYSFSLESLFCWMFYADLKSMFQHWVLSKTPSNTIYINASLNHETESFYKLSHYLYLLCWSGLQFTLAVTHSL